MRPYWDLLDEAHSRESERLAGAERARLRAGAVPGPRRNALTLRTAALLRQVADNLEARSVRTA